MSKETKSTTENKPPEWATPLFTQSAEEAKSLYNSGAGGNTYQGSTVAPLSGTTMAGINQLARAGANSDTSASRSLFQQIGTAAASNPYGNYLTQLAGGVNPSSVNFSGTGGATNTTGLRAGLVGFNGAGGTTDTSGLNARNVSTSGFNPIASGAQGIGTEADYRKLLSGFSSPSAAEQYLTQYASGDYLDPAKNPYYSKALQDQLDQTAAQVQSQFSGAGRYGSGANTDVLTDTLGRTRTAALADQFAREQANQFNAVGAIDAARNAAAGNQLSAVSGISGVQGQNIANRLSALNSAAGIDAGNADRALQAGNLRAGYSAGDLDRALQADTTRATVQSANADRSLQAGNLLAGYSAGDLDRGLQAATTGANIQAGNADRALAGQTLQGNLLANAGNMYSTGVGQAQNAAQSIAGLDQQQFQNNITGANTMLQAGGLVDNQAQQQLADSIAQWYANDNQDWTRLGLLQAAAAGSAGNYGTQVQTARQPIGLGGIFSGLGSMFSKSDARLKERIVPVGYRHGHVLWEFSYKGSAERFRGVMAQFVLDTQPDAVVMEEDGFYAVDYSAIGFPMERLNP